MEKIRQLLRDKDPIKWLFYGDSITQGSYHTQGHRDYTELFSERIRFEMGRRLDVIINTAVSGDTSYDLINRFEWSVAQFDPHVVFIMVGINDCCDDNPIPFHDFRNNLIKLIDDIKKADGLPILQTPCGLLIKSCKLQKRFQEMVGIIRYIGESKNIPLIDHATYWEKNPDKAKLWMNDETHPNKYGHRVLANYLFKSLAIDSSAYASSNLFFP